MARTLHDLESEALGLEAPQRAELAKTLIRSLDALSDSEYEQLWAEEAEARLRDFEAGNTTAIDGDEVFSRTRARKR